jgi:hypothetical protein
MKKSTETFNMLHKEKKFMMMDLDHLNMKFKEENENLRKITDHEYEELLISIKNGKSVILQVS